MKKNKISIFVMLALIVFTPTIFVSAEELIPEIAPIIVPEIQEPIDVPPTEESIPQNAILIRNGDTIVYNSSVDLPGIGSTDIFDSSGVAHPVNNRSVLGVLYALDQANDSFSLSNLQYYDSFSSFYVKCITLAEAGELCDSWQYVVGATSPSTSVDGTTLSGGEAITLYFGNPYKLELSSTSITTSDSITATAGSYNYTDNTWGSRTGVTIGVTTPNPNDPWNPIVVASYPVDANGQAILSFVDAGSYTVGISEDYYFPSYPIVINPVSSGGGGDGPSAPASISIPNAVNFITSKQKADGSFGDMLYTDWVAIALASSPSVSNSVKSSLMDYFKNNPMNSSIVTDNERHAMALMTLGINPYSGTSINYIDKIMSAFDGNQFGDTSLVNDDIFALIVLSNAGYSSVDEPIKNSVSYVVSHQSSDGSWVGVDMTAAAIEALRNFTSISGVSDAISKAEIYLVNSQSSDGGFGNSFASSWVLQALSQDSSFNSQVVNIDKYLASKQQSDGGLELETESLDNRIWATSYAIPAALHLSWSDIMDSFSKELNNSNSGDTVTTNTDEKPAEPVVVEEKLPEEKSIEDIIPKIEKPKVKTKIVKKNTVENPIIIEASDTVTPNGIVAGASTSRSKFSIIMNSVLSTILAPFTWLLVHLGF